MPKRGKLPKGPSGPLRTMDGPKRERERERKAERIIWLQDAA